MSDDAPKLEGFPCDKGEYTFKRGSSVFKRSGRATVTAILCNYYVENSINYRAKAEVEIQLFYTVVDSVVTLDIQSTIWDVPSDHNSYDEDSDDEDDEEEY
jgi:hypothetical protein